MSALPYLYIRVALKIIIQRAITALPYGKKAIGYNYTHYEKTNQLFELFQLGNYCIYHAAKLGNSIENIAKYNNSQVSIYAIISHSKR